MSATCIQERMKSLGVIETEGYGQGLYSMAMVVEHAPCVMAWCMCLQHNWRLN